MMIKKTLVKIKEHLPYVGDMEGKVLLNSMARATWHQENSKMLSHAYLYLFALVLKIRSFFSYLGLKFIR